MMALSSPYGITMAQGAAIMVGIGYLMTIGFASLTLLLSPSCIRCSPFSRSMWRLCF
ncbi:MAG: hypothetical protein ACLT98_08710 [Eggerthellaceae bacterium]